MNQVLVSGIGEISYKVLSKYHFTAEEQFNSRTINNQAVEEEYPFELIIYANDAEEAKEIYLKYVAKLNELGVFAHLGNLIYLTKNLIDYEGNVIIENFSGDKILRENLNMLTKLLNLKEHIGRISIQVKYNPKDKGFEDSLNISNSELILGALNGAINSLVEKIKADPTLRIDLVEEITNLNIFDIQAIRNINRRLVEITERAFKSQLLFTICRTLRDYLKDWSPMINPTAVLTNDQARVIYETCKIFGLIDLSHEIDYEKVNYIRAVINNKTHNTPINFSLVTNSL